MTSPRVKGQLSRSSSTSIIDKRTAASTTIKTSNRFDVLMEQHSQDHVIDIEMTFVKKKSDSKSTDVHPLQDTYNIPQDANDENSEVLPEIIDIQVDPLPPFPEEKPMFDSIWGKRLDTFLHTILSLPRVNENDSGWWQFFTVVNGIAQMSAACLASYIFYDQYSEFPQAKAHAYAGDNEKNYDAYYALFKTLYLLGTVGSGLVCQTGWGKSVALYRNTQHQIQFATKKAMQSDEKVKALAKENLALKKEIQYVESNVNAIANTLNAVMDEAITFGAVSKSTKHDFHKEMSRLKRKKSGEYAGLKQNSFLRPHHHDSTSQETEAGTALSRQTSLSKSSSQS